MKKFTLLAVMATLFFNLGTFAQKSNTDSLSLVARISSNQLKLGKMQNEVEQKTTNKVNANTRAQASANDNADAAAKLSSNPNNQKLARQANNSAGDAKADARSARKEARRLNNLNSDISKLKIKISKDQDKLDKLTGTTTSVIR